MKRLFAPLVMCLMSTTAAPAMDWTQGEMARIALLSGWVQKDGSRMMGVKISMADGWHTYWRSPGDAGIPPSLVMAFGSDATISHMHWPVPQVYDQNGMRYVGYEGEVVFPFEVTSPDPNTLEFNATLSIGVCKDICVPMQAELSGSFAKDAIGEGAKELKAALQSKPKPLAKVTCSNRPISDGVHVEATVKIPSLGADEHAVLELPDTSIWVSPAELSRSGNTLTIASDFVPEDALPFSLSRSDITISVFGDGKAYEAQGCSAS